VNTLSAVNTQRNVKGRPNRCTGGLGGFAQRAQDEREDREPLLAVDAVVLGDLAAHDQLGDQDEEPHEAAAGAARLLHFGEVVLDGLPLGLVPATDFPRLIALWDKPVRSKVVVKIVKQDLRQQHLRRLHPGYYSSS
jgi:hypothetical protein